MVRRYFEQGGGSRRSGGYEATDRVSPTRPVVRMQRLRECEVGRQNARIAAGGDMAEGGRALLDFAASYDSAGPEQRSRSAHELWLAAHTCPVLRLDSSAPVDDLVAAVCRELGTIACWSPPT